MSEGEEHSLLLRVIPLVTDLDTFVIADREGSQPSRNLIPHVGPLVIRNRLRRRLHHGRMWQVGFGPRERQRKLRAGIDLSEQYVCHRI